jgi:beta-galactosidase
MGFNYNRGAHDAWHKAHLKKPGVGSETASTVSRRGIYSTDKLRNWVSAYDVNHTAWSQLAEEWWKFYAARKWLAGGFAWTGFDDRGEPTPYGWPSINSQFGIVDTCGFPEDNFYYYEAWWGSEPVLHLLPHWNWDQREGEPISAWVHSNLDSVEVFLNHRAKARRKCSLSRIWTGKSNTSPACSRPAAQKTAKWCSSKSARPPVTRGRFASPRTAAKSTPQGEDVSVLRVEVLDKEGRMIPTPDNMISLKVTGEGKLIGVGNGDPNCQESDKDPKRNLFNGLAQVIVQATRTPGTITVEAYTEDWPPPKLPVTRVTITTKKVELRPAVT